MRQGMGTWLTTSRHPRRRTTLHHTSHHGPSLANLRNPRTCYPSMHLLAHSNPRLLPTTRDALIGRVSLSHWVTAVGNSSMAGHACWVRGEGLAHTRHHGRNKLGCKRTRISKPCCMVYTRKFWEDHTQAWVRPSLRSSGNRPTVRKILGATVTPQ
jgi:hypothetical protein